MNEEQSSLNRKIANLIINSPENINLSQWPRAYILTATQCDLLADTIVKEYPILNIPDIMQINNMMVTQKMEIDALKNELEEKNIEIKRLKENNKDNFSKTKMAELIIQNSSMQEEIEKLKDIIHKTEYELQEWNTIAPKQFEKMEEKIISLKERLRNKYEEVEQLEKKIHKLENKNDELNKELWQAEKFHSDIMDVVTSWGCEINCSFSDKENKNKELEHKISIMQKLIDSFQNNSLLNKINELKEIIKYKIERNELDQAVKDVVIHWDNKKIDDLSQNDIIGIAKYIIGTINYLILYNS